MGVVNTIRPRQTFVPDSEPPSVSAWAAGNRRVDSEGPESRVMLAQSIATRVSSPNPDQARGIEVMVVQFGND